MGKSPGIGVASFALAVVVVGGCHHEERYRSLPDTICTAGVGDLGGDVRFVERAHWRELHWNDPPLKPRRIRRSDLRRYPRSDFSFELRTDHGYRVDTRTGIATKDMVIDPDTTIALRLTPAELDTIYRAAISMRIFEYQEPHPVLETNGGFTCPSSVYYLHVEAGGYQRDLRWGTAYNPGGKTLDQWRRLYDLVHMIQRTVAKHPEYQALPPAKGGYL